MTACKRPDISSPAGYTLLEIMVVVGCAAVIFACAVPNLSRLQQVWTLWGGTHLLETSLQWGRMHAITANTSVMLQVDEGGRRFYWVDAANGEQYAATVRYFPGQVRLVGFPKRPLRFYQRGNAAPAGTFTLRGEAGEYKVIVNLGGRIRVEKQ